MTEPFPAYHEKAPGLARQLAESGSLCLVLLDVSPFAAIGEQYGGDTLAGVKHQLFKLLADQSGKEFRKEDIVALDEPHGLYILLFLSRNRTQHSDAHQHLDSLKLRLAENLVPLLARTAVPYLKSAPRISIGTAVALHNPLISSHHILLRAVCEAVENAVWQRRAQDMESLHRLQEVILSRRIITFYQPIFRIRDRKLLGYEALSRPTPETGMQTADQLFGAANHNRLLVELDRFCRSRALLSSASLEEDAKIFINTLPATIRDPEFRGAHLVGLLEKAGITPDRIVIEITEKLVIDNLSLFQEAMAYFTDLGMSLAVDDVGSGYSGLETIARLRPAYLKVDFALVHNLHTSLVNREMLRAILALGRGIGAQVIAEGIQTSEELDVLQELGVDFGQGFFLGRPEPAAVSQK